MDLHGVFGRRESFAVPNVIKFGGEETFLKCTCTKVRVQYLYEYQYSTSTLQYEYKYRTGTVQRTSTVQVRAPEGTRGGGWAQGPPGCIILQCI